MLLRLLGRKDSGLRAKPEAITAGEAMTSPPITIEPFAPVSAAAERMLEAGVHRLPVVSRERLAGIVTRADLVRAFVRSDEEIAREIRERVLISDTDAAVEVVVNRGVVELSGTVDSKLDAEVIPSFVERVPGVVKVVAKLDWRWDPETGRSSSPH